MSGTCPCSKLFEITLRQWTQPAPWFAQRSAATIDEEINGRFAGEKRMGQRPMKKRIPHDKRRRNAPTSLTLREQACAGAQRRSRDENPSYSRSPGVTPERPNQARKPGPSQAWSIPPRGEQYSSFPWRQPLRLVLRSARLRSNSLHVDRSAIVSRGPRSH